MEAVTAAGASEQADMDKCPFSLASPDQEQASTMTDGTFVLGLRLGRVCQLPLFGAEG